MRIKRGVSARARHKKILNATKGMQHARTRSYRLGKQGVIKALSYSYRDRRTRKRDLRALWITRINNASRELGMSYSQLIAGLKAKGVTLDRKILAELAVNNPEAFKKIVETAKNSSTPNSSTPNSSTPNSSTPNKPAVATKEK